MTLLLLALLAAGPYHAAEVRAAEERCDLEVLRLERARLRDELGRAMWEPERAEELAEVIRRLDDAIRRCPEAV